VPDGIRDGLADDAQQAVRSRLRDRDVGEIEPQPRVRHLRGLGRDTHDGDVESLVERAFEAESGRRRKSRSQQGVPQSHLVPR